MEKCSKCGDSTPARLQEQAYGMDGDCRTNAISSVPWGELCLRHQLASAEAERDRLREAMKEAHNIIGPSVPKCCQGRSHEWGEALRILGAALKGATDGQDD